MQQALFWDEILYGCAVQMLSENIRFSPLAIAPDFSRGHPIFFHFLYAKVYPIFGLSPIIGLKLTNLSIALGLMTAVFWITRKIADEKWALCATLLFSLQDLFFVQAHFILPEILLSLLCLLSIYCFLKRKFIGLFICVTLALFTKESAFTLWVSLGFTSLFFREDLFKKLLTLFFSALCISLYFIWQKSIFGWMFFPYHTQLISFDLLDVLEKSKVIFYDLFLRQGRFIWIGLFVWLWIIKRKSIQFKEPLFLALIFITSYLLFCLFNFYTSRYLLSILPILFILFGFSLSSSPLNPRYKHLFCALSLCLSAGFLILDKGNTDTRRGSQDLQLITKQMSSYVESKLSNTSICTDYIIAQTLELPCAGYIDQPLNNIQFTGLSSPHKYAITSSYNRSLHLSIHDNKNYKLLKKFQKNRAHINLYRRIP